MPADRRPPPVRHGRPRSPSAKLVSGGGAQDRPTARKSCHEIVGSVPSHERERRTTVQREVVRPGSSLLPGLPGLCGGPGPRFRSGSVITGWPGRNGAHYALTVIRTGRPVINGSSALCLPWRAASRGPPSSSGASCGRLQGTAICALRTEGGQHQPPGWSPPLCMESDDL